MCCLVAERVFLLLFCLNSVVKVITSLMLSISSCLPMSGSNLFLEKRYSMLSCLQSRKSRVGVFFITGLKTKFSSRNPVSLFSVILLM